MLKRKNSYFLGLLLVGLLVGCGGGGTSSSDNNDNGTSEQVDNNNDSGQHPVDGNGGTGASDPSTPTPPPSTASTFSADVMPILTTNCKGCHGTNGRFSISSASGTYANISDLQGSMQASAQYLLDKGSNSIGHGGGQVIAPASAPYNTIKSWIDSGADLN